MRVIAGSLGGRQFNSPGGNRTHPMSDKIRGALFNALGDIDNLSVLDAFAGSGALSFEAISRGASIAVAIDNDRSAQNTLSENVKALQLQNSVKVIKASANAWLSTTDDKFDIVLLDPPYMDVQSRLLHRIAERAAAGGVIVFSLPPGILPGLPSGYEELLHKQYGDAELHFYRAPGAMR